VTISDELSKAQFHELGLVSDIVSANHILVAEGVLDGFGHVSARSALDEKTFFLARSMAPALVSEKDILHFNLAGEPIDRPTAPTYLERFIHSEIYARHPTVRAIVHSHAPSVIPFGITGVPLRPVYHMSAFLGAGAPVFEIRKAGAPATDMLIRSAELGASLAAELDASSAVILMRGHGNVVIGDSVPQVVFRAVYTQINARLQLDAMSLAKNQLTYLNGQEAAAADATNAKALGRAWDMWKSRDMSRSGSG
jgi:ribulose-5-phosphate 4-epimerase/fuculose-1-phosphate aldolase